MEGSEPVAVSCGKEEAWKEEQGEVMEEKEEGGLEVKWERFLSRKSLRVLLVESDDSTRQIIAALLRKCSYKVAAVADGLKAWETLKENSFNIDLVLTEVELPAVSGFSLLTMIMEHDTFKNIPVIMMSSHDSINMVFKCMLKGAADFLVKPIRKNELRNMWQHVWRRHSFNVEPDRENGYQGEMLAEQKFKGNSEKNSDGNHSSDFVACAQNTRESSEKGSDAQSSCTRPDMEGDSVYMQSVQDLKETNYRSVSLMNETRVQEGEECIESDEVVPMHDNETEDCVKDTNITCDSKDQNFDQANSFGEVIDLIGAIDNHSNCSYGLHKNGAAQDEFPGDAKNHVDAQDQKGMSSTMLMLELSLRRCQPSSYTQDNDKSNMLNHSNSSAFSWYNNRMVPAPIAISTNFRSESKDCFSWSQKSPPIQGPFHTNTASQCSGVMQNMNMEDTNSPYIGHSTPEGTADQCSRLGVIPFPVPIGGMTYNNLCATYGSEPRFPVPTNPTIEEAVHLNLSHHSEPEAINSGLSHNPHDQSSKGQIYQAKQHQVQNLESVEDQRRISSITGQSGSSSNGDISRSHLNSSGCESVCNGSNANLTATNVVQTTADSGNTVLFVRDRNNPTDYHCSNQREAALTKFRLKRKDRCFEKKVRYQSRKRLAEQRPRVKGQFVRQVPTDHQSTEDDR